MSNEKITIEEALITLSRAAGGRYVSIDVDHGYANGRMRVRWSAYRADMDEGWDADTMEEALAQALKGISRHDL